MAQSSEITTRNPAARLAAILRAAQQVGGNRSLDTWMRVFRLPKQSEARQQIEATRLLGLMHEQLRLVREGAVQLGLRTESYEAALNRVEQALLPSRLLSGWSDAASFLTADAYVALDMFADLLPSDQSVVAADVLASLLEEINEFEQYVREAEIDDDLKLYLFRHIDALRVGLREYPIRGAEGLKHAYERASWEAPPAARPGTEDESALTKFRRVVGRSVIVLSLTGTAIAGVAQVLESISSIQRLLPDVADGMGIELPPGLRPRLLGTGDVTGTAMDPSSAANNSAPAAAAEQ